jgi:hypothetical protein
VPIEPGKQLHVCEYLEEQAGLVLDLPPLGRSLLPLSLRVGGFVLKGPGQISAVGVREAGTLRDLLLPQHIQPTFGVSVQPSCRTTTSYSHDSLTPHIEGCDFASKFQLLEAQQANSVPESNLQIKNPQSKPHRQLR